MIEYILIISDTGYVKKLDKMYFQSYNLRRKGKAVFNFDSPKNNGSPTAILTGVTDKHEIYMLSKMGRVFRGLVKDITPKKTYSSVGIKAMELDKDDEIIYVDKNLLTKEELNKINLSRKSYGK